MGNEKMENIYICRWITVYKLYMRSGKGMIVSYQVPKNI